MLDWKILVVDEIHPIFFEKINALHIDYEPKITYSELKEKIQYYDILILRSRFIIDESILQNASMLKIIGRLGSGVDNIDIHYLKQKNIELVSAPEGNRNAVAEQVIGSILSLLNNVRKSHLEMQEGIWDRKGNRGIELESLNVGVIGYGNVGSRLIELLIPFDCKIYVYDKFKEIEKNSNFEVVTIEGLLRNSDIVSVHIPYNSENHHFVNDDFFSQMRRNSMFLNFSRGGILDTHALIDAMKNKIITGCALDVFENEKPSTFSDNEKITMDFLLHHPNIICTPHIAGLTHQSFEKTALIIAEKIKIISQKWVK